MNLGESLGEYLGKPWGEYLSESWGKPWGNPYHFGQFTHPVGEIPPWLPRTLGDRSKVKCSPDVLVSDRLLQASIPDLGAILQLAQEHQLPRAIPQPTQMGDP